MNKFTLQSSLYDITLNMECKNNILLGDSATGKTLICNLIRSISKEKGLAQKIYKSNFDLNKVHAIFNEYELASFDWDEPGRIVFIDRADIYLTRDDALKINRSPNIFYIASRDLRDRLPLNITLESYLTLHHTVKDGKHYITTKRFI